MTAISIVLVDDEAPARAKLRRALAADLRFAVIGEAADGLAAVELIEALTPDLVVLDVQMPGLTGFEVLDALAVDARPEIIFATAHDRYALDAFDAAAIDYLLKPWDQARLTRALDRACARIRAGSPPPATTGALTSRLPAPARLLVKHHGALVPIPIADVTRLVADDKHVIVHTARATYHVRQPLRALEARLAPNQFARAHRGELVALAAVARVEPWTHGDALIVLVDGTTVVLSRTFREAFVAQLGDRAPRPAG